MDRIVFLNQFIGQHPSDMFALHALALEWIKKGNDLEAENLFKEILQRQPDYIGTYYHLGKLLERAEKKEEAIDVYEVGIKESERQKDQHALRELRAAYNQLKDEMD